jgi:hypothetical protein
LLLSATGNLNLAGGNIFVNSPITFRGTVSGITTAAVTTGNVAEEASSGNLYYTNARVHSNIIAALPTYTGNIGAGNLVLTGGIIDNVGVLTIATTSNSNIELTAAGTGRILLDGQAWPHTDGVAGYVLQTNGTGNLFWAVPASSFANANVASFLTTYTGNISAGNVIANTVISPSATSGTLNSTGNLNIIAQNNTINLTASNVLASGNIIANTFIATGTGSAELSTSSNLLLSATGNLNLAGGNIFVNSPITFRGTVTGISAGGSVTQANLTTANVAELASSGNLYYTNARVVSNVIAYLAANPQGSQFANANVAAFLITYTGNINTGNVIANAFYANGTGAAGGTIFSAGNVNITSGGNIILATGANSSVVTLSSGNTAGIINGFGDLTISTSGNILLSPQSTGRVQASTPIRFANYSNTNALATALQGDTVYNTTANALVVYTSSGWTTVGSGGAGGSAAAAVGYSLIFGG